MTGRPVHVKSCARRDAGGLRVTLFGGRDGYAWHMLGRGLASLCLIQRVGSYPGLRRNIPASGRQWSSMGRLDCNGWPRAEARARQQAMGRGLPRHRPVGGYETMCSMRETLEAAIALAPSVPAAQRPRVYLTDWRLDPLRDLSDNNAWKTTRAWTATDTATKDQTAAGLILRMMQAGITVRVMVWYPVTVTGWKSSGWAAHIAGHLYMAQLVREECARLGVADRGIVALDIRVAAPLTATHHYDRCWLFASATSTWPTSAASTGRLRGGTRPMPSARGPTTRRRRPTRPGPAFFLGWRLQSGAAIPGFIWDANWQHRWPMQAGVNYGAVSLIQPYDRPGSDLPEPAFSATTGRAGTIST